MSQSIESSESASSEFGSLDDQFKFPSTTNVRSCAKRRADGNVEDLDEIMKTSLTLSPEKRMRMNSASSTDLSEFKSPRNEGRPQTRRSNSSDVDVSPRVRALRAATSGNTIDMVRFSSCVSSDSISPKLLKQYSSPKKRINLNENGSIYSKHRLGSTFSPLIVGGRRKMGTPSHSHRVNADKSSPMDSPRLSGLRRKQVLRTNRPLSDRLQSSLD